MAAVQYAVIPLMYHLGNSPRSGRHGHPLFTGCWCGACRSSCCSSPSSSFLKAWATRRSRCSITIAANLANIRLQLGVHLRPATDFPRWAPRARAWARWMSRIIAPMLMIGYFYSRSKYRVLSSKAFRRATTRGVVRQLLHMGLPISMQMFLEASAFVGHGNYDGVVSTRDDERQPDRHDHRQLRLYDRHVDRRGHHIRVFALLRARATSANCRSRQGVVPPRACAWNALAALVFITMRNVIPTSSPPTPR